MEASHPYTCNTCQVAWRNADLQKGHMKSDWHRYNLKRRVASLPPITAEVFTDRVLEARAASTAEAAKATFEKICEACQKTYYSEGAYRNHVSSQKHRARVAVVESAASKPVVENADSVVTSTFSLGQPIESEGGRESEEEDDDDKEKKADEQKPEEEMKLDGHKPGEPEDKQDEQELPGTELIGTEGPRTEGTEGSQDRTADRWPSQAAYRNCLFCNHKSHTVPLNLRHMERRHGMFIPEKRHLVDFEGLMSHLEERVLKNFECLFCGRAKANAYAVQTHMRDKGHCKIPYVTEGDQLDIGEFYDFRSTYSDGEDGEDDEGEENGLDDGWETDSSVDSVDLEFEKTELPPHARNKGAFVLDGYELHLPSGRVAGHRSLNRYYKQNLYGHPSEEDRAEMLALEAAEAENAEAAGEVMPATQARALVPRNVAGLLGVAEHKQREARKSERKGRSQADHDRKREDWVVGKRLNNHKSYYYRYNGGG